MSEGYFTQTIDDSGQTYQHQVKNSFDGSTLNEDNLIITEDPELRHILKIAENVARSKATVLIQGESGTGKNSLHRIFIKIASAMVRILQLTAQRYPNNWQKVSYLDMKGDHLPVLLKEKSVNLNQLTVGP